MEKINLLEILNHVDPSQLNYSEWLSVGMALKYEGYSAYDWDTWSRKDTARYKDNGECYNKWESFNEDSGSLVTAGTVVQYAKNQGFNFTGGGRALDWDDVISVDELVVIDSEWLEDREVEEPSDSNWEPVSELIKYLSVLFESTENVGYVTDTYQDKEDGRYLPTKGNFKRTAGKLIQELSQHKDDLGAVLGDYNPMAGAWIRFNPLDGNGVKNENVTDYRYALVESDTIPIEKQNAIIRELELPVAALVYSGGKSVHAIVRIEAGSLEEYRKRVNYLYDVCSKNGLVIDTQNRNPSRLSRMPGVIRNGNKQFLMDTNIGKKTWTEWEEWIEGVNDDLPDPESLEDNWNDMPELAPPLIDGVLRQGHKMLIAGPSKAGKSFALIGLSIAIAEGKKWFGWSCTQGRVLYVNLELDRASALHRFKDVYNALELPPKHINNIDIWNLRGKVVPMDKLAPKLIRRAQKKEYIAVIIDPIYKVITGDENSASEMANFTNQFDKVASELGSSVIYVHHHSKGSQGNKRSMDRASGSGVFARDPDALIDLVELELTEGIVDYKENEMLANYFKEELKRINPSYYDKQVGIDDELSAVQMRNHIGNALDINDRNRIDNEVVLIKKRNSLQTAWRVEGTLREYPKFPPLNIWFEYPIHKVDEVGILKDVDPEGTFKTNEQRRQKGADTQKKKGNKTRDKIENGLNNLIGLNGETTYQEVLDFINEDGDGPKTDSPIRNFLRDNADKYEIFEKEGERTKYVRYTNDVVES